VDGEKTPSEVQFETMQQELVDAIKMMKNNQEAQNMLNFKQMIEKTKPQPTPTAQLLLPQQRPPPQ
jgi:hypothetical protein